MSGYVFDRNTAREILDQARRNRGRVEDHYAVDPTASADTDVRFVVTPDTQPSIDALTRVETPAGSGTYVNTPGHEDCDTAFGTYDPNSDTRLIELAEDSEGTHQETIHNVHPWPAPPNVVLPSWLSNDGTRFIAPPVVKVYARTRSGGIGAASSGGNCTYVTPGSATCDLWYWDAANSRYAKKIVNGSAVDVTVYNFFRTAIPGDTLIVASYDESGHLSIDSADCATCT